jgi:uncharacterized protein (DUF1330 family)
MSAFVISEVRIVDAEAARQYMALAEESIVRHGGRYIARAADPDVPEGCGTRAGGSLSSNSP